jgi:class 3 adenylate cyclase
MRRSATLVYNPHAPEEQRFTLHKRIVIGRRRPKGDELGETVMLADPVVSGRHCILLQTGDGRFLIRDVSRNGTRVRGKRLIPNVEVEIHPGDRIQVGSHEFLLESDQATLRMMRPDDSLYDNTRLVDASTEVSILMGDVRGYTSLNQRYGPSEVFANLGRVFAELEAVVLEHDGAIKEYQGDAIFSYWEANPDAPCCHARRACQAALASDARLRALAGDPGVWSLRDSPLQMEWAVTTGSVVLSSMGRDRPVGLAMVGEPVNYAFRLEKLAGEDTGTILVCDRTEALCRSVFRFRELGPLPIEGHAEARHVFALEGVRTQSPR